MAALSVDSQITFLYTRDLEGSAHFYENILGLPLAVNQGSCRIYHIVGRKAYIGLCQRDATLDNPTDMIFTLVTPDVDAWYEQIRSHGWECEHPPRHNKTYGIYHFFVRDPNGHLLEVQRFDQEDWDQPNR